MKTTPSIATALIMLVISLQAVAQNDKTLADASTSATTIAPENTLTWGGVYPVPVISTFTINVNSTAQAMAVIRLIDLQGRTAMERPVDLNSGDNRFDVSMADMPAGTYQLVLQTDNKRLTYRLEKGQ